MAANVLSNTLGSISIACSIVVYSPQYLENYKRQSAEGLDILFVNTWLVADFCNLLGAWLAQLLPTVIILAIYYTVCDLALLLQIYYYRWKSARLQRSAEAADQEDTPLLGGDAASRKSAKPESALLKLWSSIQHFVSIVFVAATGVVAWLMSEKHGSHGDQGPHYPDSLEVPVQVLGWSSALLYLAGRVPQILKNVKTGSAGLSPALFLWTILGNLTYGLSICAGASTSTDPRYWVTNASWLAGSLLVMLLDIIVRAINAFHLGTDFELLGRYYSRWPIIDPGERVQKWRSGGKRSVFVVPLPDCDG